VPGHHQLDHPGRHEVERGEVQLGSAQPESGRLRTEEKRQRSPKDFTYVKIGTPTHRACTWSDQPVLPPFPKVLEDGLVPAVVCAAWGGLTIHPRNQHMLLTPP
jgi:hypothetical protein